MSCTRVTRSQSKLAAGPVYRSPEWYTISPEWFHTPDDTYLATYTTLEVLGKGGYGTVTKALDNRTGTHVAIKIMDNRRIRNQTFSKSKNAFIPNEILLWEGLNHPSIPKLLDVVYDGELQVWFLVMEYDSQFSDMFDYIDRNGALTTADSVEVIRQLVEVVQYLALMGVDHRDLKDENILYNPHTKQIKLIDYGSAAHLENKPYVGFRGTDVYIPPEYFSTGCYRPFPATVWAIGCIAYILLAGDSPFQSRADVVQYRDLGELNPKYKERTLRTNFIRSCMTVDPTQRILLSDLTSHPWLKRKPRQA
eukprot:sb/3467158/